MLLKNASILVIDDDPDVLTAVRLLLKTEAKEVVTEKNPENKIVSFLELPIMFFAILKEETQSRNMHSKWYHHKVCVLSAMSNTVFKTAMALHLVFQCS